TRLQRNSPAKLASETRRSLTQSVRVGNAVSGHGEHEMLDQPYSPAEPDLFSPAIYVGVRRPLEDAETLPPFCYSSETFFRREVDRIFMKAWNFIGRADRIPNPGDYITLEFVGVPVVVVRDSDGEV